MTNKRALKIAVLLAFLLVLGLALSFGLHKGLSFERLKANQVRLHEEFKVDPFWLTVSFVSTYIAFNALALPGSLILSLAAGALFGTWWGTLIVSFASTIGATLSFWFARFVFRDLIQRHFGEKLKVVNEGFRREGVAYLFTLRLIPLFPFFLINLAMGLVPIPTWTFFWVSQLGMLPATFIYVNAGTALAAINSPDDILTWNLVISMTLVGCLPVAAKWLVKKWKSSGCPSA